MKHKPTEEQIKEFWEWYGFEFVPHLSSRGTTYKTTEIMEYPDGFSHVVNKGESLDIDLNNLFKYAVPKMTELGYDVNLFTEDGYCFGRARKTSALKWQFSTIGYLYAALALFWALWKVKEANARTKTNN